jgi:hypothetical protein
LATKSLETVRLTEALVVSPEDDAARGALAEHLSDLRDSAAELGFVHLEGAVAEVLTRLEHDSFDPSSLVAVRVLAWRYESLAGMPSQSGTHRVVEAATQLEALLQSDREATGDLEEFGVAGLLRAARRLRPDASIVLQDPRNLFELELREGRIVQVTRTSIDGEVTQGAAAFPALVRMGSGRFVVAERIATAEPLPSPGPGRELIPSEIQQDSWPVADPVERENVRAQVAVSMHREPANQAPDWGYPIWRLHVGVGATGRESSSGFGMEMRAIPRLLGLAFATLLSATVAFLIWHQVTTGGAPTAAPATAPTLAKQPRVTPDAPAATPMAPAGSPAFAAFSGSLRAGVDPSLEVSEGQGVLELIGPAEVSVEVDGVDRGALPVTLALDHGRHTVRYGVGAKSTYRFYYVKSGATRALKVLTQAGGLVDAR